MRFTCYCSSSSTVDEHFREAARRLGGAIAARGDELVYGGTSVGLMGVLAEAVRAGGGRVSGVVPELMEARGLADHAADELVVTEGMSGRKQEMITRADAFVALPGGFGTLEELFEVLTLKQLGYHRKPIVLLDVQRFWTPLLELFETLYATGFARPEYAALYHVAADVEDLLAYVDAYDPEDLPTKWW
ncbi:MAG: TIGR00730 family Rossman fold protein [Actinobacteria bacterium]|nr:TIGR00730 family Rossman fold protein [Actinomycetota bacterium]